MSLIEENTFENSDNDDDDDDVDTDDNDDDVDDDDDVDSALYSAEERFYSSSPTPPPTQLDWRTELLAKQRVAEGPLYEVPTVNAIPIIALLESYPDEEEHSIPSHVSTSTIFPLAVHLEDTSFDQDAVQSTVMIPQQRSTQEDEVARKTSQSNQADSGCKKKSLWIACISTLVVTFVSGLGLGMVLHNHVLDSGTTSASSTEHDSTREHHLRVSPSLFPSSGPESSALKCSAKTWVPIGSPISSQMMGGPFANAVSSLSYDGRTIAIARPSDGNASVYIRVFYFDGAQWKQMGNDIYFASMLRETFGLSLSLSGDGTRIVVGVQSDSYELEGHSKIFEFDGSVWKQLGDTIRVGENSGDITGLSVSMSRDGTICAIGTIRTYAGSFVRILKYNGSEWIQMGDILRGHTFGEGFGYSLSLSEDGWTVAVGAPFADTREVDDAGKVYIYQYNGSDWVTVRYPIEGVTSRSQTGASIDISAKGDIVAVGSPMDNVFGPRAGQVEVFHLNETDWVQLGHSLYGTNSDDEFGSSISLSYDGSKILVGSPHRGVSVGDINRDVQAFQFVGNDWTEISLDFLSPSEGKEKGFTAGLSDDGNSIVLGFLDTAEMEELGSQVLVYQASSCDSKHF